MIGKSLLLDTEVCLSFFKGRSFLVNLYKNWQIISVELFQCAKCYTAFLYANRGQHRKIMPRY